MLRSRFILRIRVSDVQAKEKTTTPLRRQNYMAIVCLYPMDEDDCLVLVAIESCIAYPQASDIDRRIATLSIDATTTEETYLVGFRACGMYFYHQATNAPSQWHPLQIHVLHYQKLPQLGQLKLSSIQLRSHCAVLHSITHNRGCK